MVWLFKQQEQLAKHILLEESLDGPGFPGRMSLASGRWDRENCREDGSLDSSGQHVASPGPLLTTWPLVRALASEHL